MLAFHDARDDVVALTVSERLTGADVDALLAMLDDRLARFPKVHVFVEARAVGSVDVRGLAGHVSGALPLLGRLGQFGRVAVVADQAWVRAITRAKSAILPFVSFRVFEPHRSAEALGWVKGELSLE